MHRNYVHDMREVFNAIRYVAKNGVPVATVATRFSPLDGCLPADAAMDAGRRVRTNCPRLANHAPCLVNYRTKQPSATILDGRTLQSTPESGNMRRVTMAAKRSKGLKAHAAVDTLGNLLALIVTAANEQERDQVGELTAKLQEVTGGTVSDRFCGSRLHR